MEPGILGRLVDMGWTRSSLAFFHGMPEEEVTSLLPGIAEDWTQEEFLWLQREAKRQRTKLDLEDHVFLQHQKLLYKDQAYIDKQLDKTAAGTQRSAWCWLGRVSLCRGSRGRLELIVFLGFNLPLSFGKMLKNENGIVG